MDFTLFEKRIDFFKPTVSSGGGEFDPATSVTLKMVLDQDEADAGRVTCSLNSFCLKDIRESLEINMQDECLPVVQFVPVINEHYNL